MINENSSLGDLFLTLHSRQSCLIGCFYWGWMVVPKNIIFFRFFFTFHFLLLVVLEFLFIGIAVRRKHTVIFNHLSLDFFLVVFDFGHKTHVHKIIDLLLLILRPDVLRFLISFKGIRYATCLFKLLFTCWILILYFDRCNCSDIVLFGCRRRF